MLLPSALKTFMGMGKMGEVQKADVVLTSGYILLDHGTNQPFLCPLVRPTLMPRSSMMGMRLTFVLSKQTTARCSECKKSYCADCIDP